MAEETVSCGSCGRPAAPGAMYCSGCGSALNQESTAPTKTMVASGESLTLCPSCGGRMEPGAQFCSGCGETRAVSGPGSRASVWDAVLGRLTRATKGEFEIVREVGRGAMGAVYLAKDVALSRKVAIKVISPQLLADETMVARFRLEARTVASLRHPHIVTIHAVRALDDLHYFIMDFVEGCSLRSVLKTHGPLPFPVIQALLFQVGGALAYAHRRGRGVIHRDVKPANIMIDVEGNAFVTDFGISKVAESSGLTLTGTGLIIGTPEYMSPEQCMGEPLTGAGDQYSLGVVAYEMLCGQTPFSGTQYSVLVAHGSKDPKRIEDLRPDCPPTVREAVMRMMAKAPADRWPSVDDAVAALGGAPLAHGDPVRASIIALIPGDVGGGAGLDTSSPLSPVPGASKSVSEVPTAVYVARLPEWLAPGESFDLRAHAESAEGSEIADLDIRWSSSDPSIASVENGRVLALAPGVVQITATAGSVESSLTLGVSEPTPADIVVEPSAVQVEPGEKVAVEAVPEEAIAPPAPEEAIVPPAPVFKIAKASARKPAGPRRWPRRVAGAASVLGLITIVWAFWDQLPLGPLSEQSAAQPVELPAVPDGSDLGSAASSVAAVTVTMDPPRDVIRPGDTVRLAASAVNSEGDPVSFGPVSWSVDDPVVASVDTQGLVVAREAGSTRVYAAVGGVREFVEIFVSAPEPVSTQAAANPAPAADPVATQPVVTIPPPAPVSLPVVASSISVILETPVMREEATQEIELRIVDTDGGTISDFDGVSIRSSDPSVAEVSGMRVTALGPGSAYLVATLEALSDSVLVTVEALVAGVEIQGGDLSFTVGSTIALTAEVRGSRQQLLENRAVSWRSLSPGVAEVNPTTGQATANAPGEAIIVATSEGREDRVTATVVLPVAALVPADDEPEPAPVEEAPAPLTEDRIAFEVNRFVSLLNDGDEDEVRALFGSAASATENEDLLDKMGRRDFVAELDGVGVPATGDDQTTVPFQVNIRYRSGFGGGREETGDLVATFILGPTDWQIESYTVMPGAGF